MASENHAAPSTASNADDQMKYARSNDFYFELVTFEVENCLFKVPKHEFVTQSQVFRDMFLLPPGEGNNEHEGMSDEKPIHLEGVKKEDFSLLLRILYPSLMRDIPPSLSVEECTALLHLWRMWGFKAVGVVPQRRIRGVLWGTMNPVEKIKIAHEFEFEGWYPEAYYELALRPEELSVEEAHDLGWEFSIKMGWVREKVAEARGRHAIFGKGTRGKTKEQEAELAIQKIFFPALGHEQIEAQNREWEQRLVEEELTWSVTPTMDD